MEYVGPLGRRTAVLTRFDEVGNCNATLRRLLLGAVIWTDGSISFPIGKGGSGILANCSLPGAEDAFSYSANPACSSFSVVVCTILLAF